MGNELAFARLHAAGLSHKSLMAAFSAGLDPDEVAGRADARQLAGLGVAPARVPAVRESLRNLDGPGLARKLASRGARVVLFGEDEYPPLLAQLPHPPALLYVRGALAPELTHVGVVGSRAPSAEGRAHTRSVARGLAEAGAVVTSGGAYGIDSIAHEAALEAGGLTVCVTGCGPDVDYPPRHGKLFSRIAESGAVVSVFPPGTPALAHHFPIRNEIVAGLSRGVVIAEAWEGSGTLITARLALDFCRDVFVLPGDMARESCRGSNLLLRDGHAKCVLGADDVLAEWGLARKPGEAPAPGGPADPALAPAYLAVRESPRDADALAAGLGGAPGDVAGVLARLEAFGWV